MEGRTYGRTDGRTFPPPYIIRSTFGSRPKNSDTDGMIVNYLPRRRN